MMTVFILGIVCPAHEVLRLVSIGEQFATKLQFAGHKMCCMQTIGYSLGYYDGVRRLSQYVAM